jgi:extracellular matrix regulatory protein A
MGRHGARAGQFGERKKAAMEPNLLNIGFGSTAVADRVVAIVSPNSAPMKRLKDEAKKDQRLIDATHGRRTRSIIIMDSNHIILSAIQAETISQRFALLKEGN